MKFGGSKVAAMAAVTALGVLGTVSVAQAGGSDDGKTNHERSAAHNSDNTGHANSAAHKKPTCHIYSAAHGKVEMTGQEKRYKCGNAKKPEVAPASPNKQTGVKKNIAPAAPEETAIEKKPTYTG